MTNYFDKQGNYINCENLSLAEIYHRAFALGVESVAIEDKRPQGEWILVSKRLPEINKAVIVTDIEVSEAYQSQYYGNGYWECDNGTKKDRIIAWQPLPEPYKKGGAE